MSTNPDTERLVYTGNYDRPTSFRVPDFQYTTLGRFLLYRLINNRDCKVLITSRGSTTGTGKTTLAIHLCRWIRRMANELFDREGRWTAQDYAMIDVRDYLQDYRDAEPGDALLLDEVEFSADRRRHMTHENVRLSHAWSILRYRNVITVATLPTVSMIDQRLMELGDVWINVMMRGRANSYYLTMNDFSHDLVRKRLRMAGYKESVIWPALPEDDPDFEYLSRTKEAIGIPGVTEEETFSKADLKSAEKQARIEAATSLIELKEEGEIDLTQREIGRIVGYSQQWVNKIKQTEM